MSPQKPTKGPVTQIRSHHVTFASKTWFRVWSPSSTRSIHLDLHTTLNSWWKLTRSRCSMVVFSVDELEGTDTRHQFVILPQCSLLFSALGFRTWTSVKLRRGIALQTQVIHRTHSRRSHTRALQLRSIARGQVPFVDSIQATVTSRSKHALSTRSMCDIPSIDSTHVQQQPPARVNASRLVA